MLLSFSVENYRSFKEEQTLELLASKRLGVGEEERQCCGLPGIDESALRVAALYGANGAGKSNLVRALGFVQRLINSGTAPGKRIPIRPYRLGDASPDEGSYFELQFLSSGTVFRYGFGCDSERIYEEHLGLYEGKKERTLFDRTTSEDGEVKISLGAASTEKAHTQKVQALKVVGARPNQLFLTEVANLAAAEAQGEALHKAIDWFGSILVVIRPGARFVGLTAKIAADRDFADFASRFLSESNTGVAKVEVQTEELPPADMALFSRDSFERVADSLEDGESIVFESGPGEEVIVDSSKRDIVRVHRIQALHGNSDGTHSPLSLRDESDGTIRLLNLLPALHGLRSQGAVFVVDELERSMHPMLARKFVEFFGASTNRATQLIFTTHETTLLNLDLLRRDGIWFAEKDRTGSSHIYSLADFKVRKDLRIDKGYLQGRFGAVPFLGGIDRLIPVENPRGDDE